MDNAYLVRPASGSGVSRATDPQKYRDDAASLRRKAKGVGSPEIRRQLIDLAVKYERLACWFSQASPPGGHTSARN